MESKSEMNKKGFDLYHIILKNGTVLLTWANLKDYTIQIMYPIQINHDPVVGTYGVKYLGLSVKEESTISFDDILHCLPVSESGEYFYNRYMNIYQKKKEDLEELLSEEDEKAIDNLDRLINAKNDNIH